MAYNLDQLIEALQKHQRTQPKTGYWPVMYTERGKLGVKAVGLEPGPIGRSHELEDKRETPQ